MIVLMYLPPLAAESAGASWALTHPAWTNNLWLWASFAASQAGFRFV